MRRSATILLISVFAGPCAHAAADLDHDGVSDVWRTAYPAAGAATADPDGDGATNLAESLAGTSPFSAASVLAATPVTDGSGNLVVRWRGLRGKRYQIESSTDFAAWTAQGTAFTPSADGDLTSIVRPAGSSAADTRRFWRIAVSDRDTDSDGYSDWEEYQFGGNPAVAQIPFNGPFVPLALCMSNDNWIMTPAEQIALSLKLGYTGLGLSPKDFDAERLTRFADHPEVAAGRFRIHSALYWCQPKYEINKDWIEAILAPAKRLGLAIWIVVDGGRGDGYKELARKRLGTIAGYCKAAGVPLVLYPHVGCAYENAEEGLEMRKLLASDGYPETKIAIGLFHELCTGNRDRLPTVITAVKDHLALVSINGTDYDNPGLIQPLDYGTFDTGAFIKALADAGYTGPMELLTYGLPDPRKDAHLARSMKRWRQLVAPPPAP
jgi:sugar phosphate isomerase/epimerase